MEAALFEPPPLWLSPLGTILKPHSGVYSMKMQIAFRETATVRHDHSVAMAVGIIEVGPEELQDFEEKALAFKFHFTPAYSHAVGVSVVGGPRKLVDRDGWLENTLATGTLEDLLTSHIERAIPNDRHNADFALRETELPPSVEGGVVFAFSGLVHVKHEQPFRFEDLQWFESRAGDRVDLMLFTGRSGIEKRTERSAVDMVESMRGQAISAFLQAPLWGFGEEVYGLPGTMRLDVYRKHGRYQDLVLADDRNPAEELELEELREFMRYAALDNLEKDEVFRNFVREMREQFPEFDGNRPMTADQIVSREESMGVIVASLLNSSDRYAR